MKLGIVTDSTSDLPQDLIDQYGLEVVPSILVFDGREYADGPGISRQEFYARLPHFKIPPTTAAPSIGEFSSRYQRLLDSGCQHVLSIHAAGALTAIGEAARQAARDFEARITVIDSQSLTLGLGFQVLAAAEAAANGLQAALAAVESTRGRLHLFAVLDTLDYARRSGRIPAAMTIFGGMLHIKPMIELTRGEIKSVGALRTTGQANARMAAFFRSGGPFERLAILHTGAEPRAREFLQQVMRESSRSLPRDILMVNVTPVIGAHVGPKGLGFVAVRA
ncbi:MAG TPA: DegV family protein [Anaerolineales bacterium]